MKRQFALQCKFGKRGDVVNYAVREVGRGSNKKDCVTIDETSNTWYMYLVSWGRAGDKMNPDAKVETRFTESCMCRLWENPA